MATTYIVLAAAGRGFMVAGSAEALGPVGAAKSVLGADYAGEVLVVPRRNASFLGAAVESVAPKQTWTEHDPQLSAPEDEAEQPEPTDE